MVTNRPLVWRPASSFSETRCGRNQRHCEDKIRKVRESVGVAAWQPSAEASPGAVATSGIAMIRPAPGSWTGRGSGLSFANAKCVRLR